ncbi:MAG: FkbM family methyltransferase [Pseudomonadota bacterium]
MLLSIVIPAYDRPDTLKQAIDSFVEQISGNFDQDVEVIIADDASPNQSLNFVKSVAKQYPFVKYKRYEKNIGLERNLIQSSDDARGEFLWIFGDDDFLEPKDALADIIERLKSDQFDMLVLNRTRRSKDLSKLLSPNWMNLTGPDQEFAGLREFCLKFGFISVIGFISVNIFRRSAFKDVDASKYFGTMYPQLGAMVKAFHDRPVQLVTRPLVCHRTETQEEKRAKLGNKKSEADFMADAKARDALYFSHPYIAMLNDLLRSQAFHPDEIVKIPENTVINGLLIDFLIGTVELSLDYQDRFSETDWRQTCSFFDQLPLSSDQRHRANNILRKSNYSLALEAEETPFGKAESSRSMKTISVVTPSFNQADYLDECLVSVRDQSYPAIEHFVFDPGSTDGSRSIAAKYQHASLFEEPDEGQSDALNKGFARAKGDIIAWLNSDDVFAHEGVFERIIERFNQPDAPDIVYGKGIFIGENGEKLRDVYVNKDPSTLHWRFQQEDGILQPALFMKRSVIEKMGELNGNLHYCMDYEYWIRCMKAGVKFAYIDENLALARYHDSNKTFGQRGNSYHEVCEMLMGHFGYVNHIWLRRYAEFICDGFDGVLSNANNSEISDSERLEAVYDQLLVDYNTSHLIFADLEANASQKGKGDTLREMRNRNIAPSTPCKEVPQYRESEPGHVMYNVGPKRWAFDRKWKKKQIDKSHAFLRETIANRKSDVCVIVGNGPSLKKTDLDLLKGHDVIISNNAFLDPKLSEYATYYTVVNYLVAEQSSHNINQIEGMAKILPYWTAYCLNETDETYFIDAVGHAAFSKDLFKNASWRHTVTFYNMHIAYGLGYKRAILIGFDHSYKQSKGIKEGEVILSNEKDENHFDSRYFQGKKWQAADVDMMEEMYKLAKTAFEEDGRDIVNATIGGKLELFPRMELKDALAMKPAPPKTSPSDSASWHRDDHAQLDETAVVAELLKDRVGSEFVMLDVGAHIGTSAAYFDDLDWTIYCFEPDAKNRASLVQRFQNKLSVKIDPRAVSDAPAKGVDFFTSPESSGISGLHAFRNTHEVSDLVDVTTVADIVASKGISKVDFLKIDVEGFDLSVLKGVPWTKLNPDVIECEFEDAKTLRLGHDWRFVAQFLENKGYAVYISEWHPIIKYGISHDWKCVKKFPNCNVAENSWGNILAFKNDPGTERVEEAFKKLVRFRTPKPANTEQEKSETAKTIMPAEAIKQDVHSNSGAKPSARQLSAKSQSPMLKQVTPTTELKSEDSELSGYVRSARKIHALSPRLYGLLRFFKRAAVHTWAHKVWTFPVLLVAIGLLVAALPRFELVADPFNYFMLLGGGFISAALFYVAFRSYSHIETLHIQFDRQHQEIETLKQDLNSGKALIATGSQSALIEFFREELNRTVKPNLQKLNSELAQERSKLDEIKSSHAHKLTDASAQIASLRDAADQLGTRVSHLQGSSVLREDFAKHDSKVNILSEELKALSGILSEKVETVMSETKSRLDSLQDLQNAIKADQGALETALETLEADLNAELVRVETAQAQFSETMENELTNREGALHSKLAETADTLESSLSKTSESLTTHMQELSSKIEPVSNELSEVQTNIDALKVQSAETDKWAEFNNSVWYQHFNRRLRNEHFAVLDSEWRKRLSVQIARSTLGYMANRACLIENQLDGRLATSIEDVMLRALVGRAIKGKTASVLEIGTLFGTGAAIMFDAMRGHFDNIHFTLLDPLEGYYNAAQLDLLTGQNVDEDTLRRNLDQVGMRDENFSLIKHLSTDPEAIEAAANQMYDLLIIDGDHSYAGVKTDFENYARNVKLGGFIIFDDYASPDRPEVQEYVDAELDKSDFVSKVGASWRTCVYRVVKQPAKSRARKPSNTASRTSSKKVSEPAE